MKTQAKHTPGPFLEIGPQEYRIQKGGKDICECYLWNDAIVPNGRGGGIQFFMCPIHTAIAKAEGQGG